MAITTALFAALISESHQQISKHPVELAALSLFLLSFVLLGIVFSPLLRWHFYSRPGKVRRMTTCEPRMNADEVRAKLARQIPKEINRDSYKIYVLQWVFIAALVSFGAEIACWTIGVI